MFLAPYADESATMTQSAQATISPNHHKAYILHKIIYKYMYMHLCNLYKLLTKDGILSHFYNKIYSDLSASKSNCYVH